MSSPCVYWAYNYLQDDQWVYATVGASIRTVREGDVEGWAWGAGSLTQGAAPPLITFSQICAPAAPTDTPTATPTWTPWPTNTPQPTPTWTPWPTNTPQPTSTWTPCPFAGAVVCADYWDLDPDLVAADGQHGCVNGDANGNGCAHLDSDEPVVIDLAIH
jgi:hypothetical protein